MRFVAPRAALSAVISQVERAKVVGLIALPGAMTGLLMAGADPVDAGTVQLSGDVPGAGTAALCVTALVSTVALAVTDGRRGAAPWGRPGAEVGESAAVRR